MSTIHFPKGEGIKIITQASEATVPDSIYIRAIDDSYAEMIIVSKANQKRKIGFSLPENLALVDLIENGEITEEGTVYLKTQVDNMLLDIVGDVEDIKTLLQSDDVSLDELQEIVNYIKDNKSDIENLGIDAIIGLRTYLNNIDTKNTAQDGRLTAIETKNTSQDTRLTAIEGVNTTQGTNITNLQSGKLDKPATTVANTTTFTHAVLVDASNNSAKYPAVDLGKNVANTALTSINGSGLTLGADWNITSGSGFYFGLKGLIDKSADATWNRLIMTDASGRVAYSNGKNVIKTMPSLLTEAEKTAWRTEMNGGWTTNTMSVGLLSPIVVKKQNSNSWITLKGANLNLNPVNFSVEIVDIAGTTVLATVPNSQVQLYSNGIDLTFYYNFNAFTLGNYKIRLNNGVATYVTGLAFTLTDAVNTVDLTTITWSSLLHTPDTPNVLSTNQGSIAYTSTTANKAFANDNSTVASAKSSQIIPSNVNFYLKITGSYTSPNMGATAGNLGVDTIGLCNADSGLVLGNISNVAVNIALTNYRTQDTLKINGFNETNIVTALDAVSDTFEFVVVRQNNNVVALIGYGSVYKYITIGDVPSAISLFGCFQNNVNNKTSNLVLQEAYTF